MLSFSLDKDVKVAIPDHSHINKLMELSRNIENLDSARTASWLLPTYNSNIDMSLFIAKNTRSYFNLKGFSLIILYKDELVGIVGVNTFFEEHKRGDIAAFLYPKFRGSRVAMSSLLLIISIAFKRLGLLRVEFQTLDCDQHSNKLLNRVTQFEFKRREAYFINSEYKDCNIFSFLRDEWYNFINNSPELENIVKRYHVDIRYYIFTEKLYSNLLGYEVGSDIRFRVLDSNDASELIEISNRNSNELQRWFPGWMSNIASSNSSALHYINIQQEKYITGNGCNVGIFKNGKMIGLAGLNGISIANKRGVFGMWLDKEHQSTLTGIRTFIEFISFAFYQIGLNKIEVNIDSNNSRSLNGVGVFFTKEGTRRKSLIASDGFTDLHAYSLLKSEWENIISENNKIQNESNIEDFNSKRKRLQKAIVLRFAQS